ncbi:MULTISPECIES: malonate decarboxylase holo-ACP synthase [Pseudomonas]|uniref:Phosphoribosyl-dephospho-CoA transferase n=1 Tax=Pseudomonas fluorescens TaxID=294 RepID=A0A5E7SB66_PSEFL|nr:MULTISPECIES: malonate decarboxylase holo-ACP synthase [Pseudomonas]QCY15193.1 malonate decarboxylase holo-ACP synthase [Pseudomonas sp. MPC6]VVP83766.1 Phosphoribosyl-dephospho-CoA transferase [Pseudomonas fluorescens]
MVNTLLAHDLLWGMTPEQLPADAPSWVIESIRAGQPVVVRRALSAADHIAVGVRGRLREQRYATVMSVHAIQRQVRPEALCNVSIDRDLPAVRALNQLRRMLDSCEWVWGVSGSAGFELASGFTALHEHSDLDLILRTPQPLERTQAQELVKLLDAAECLVDMQLQTPNGAVALREWAGPSKRVLLKNASEACLVTNPWNPQEQAA